VKALLTAMTAILVTSSAASASVRAYAVDPVTSAWSNKVPGQAPYGGVAQTVTCCWDSLSTPARVELFVGATGNGGLYDLDVLDDSTNIPVARKHGVSPRGDHVWQKFDTLEILGPFVKGKRYRFEFRRQGQDSLQYYWDNTDPYPTFGNLKLGQDNEPLKDLACRVYGRNRPIRADFFGSHSKYYMAKAYDQAEWEWAGDSMANSGFRLDRDGIDMFKVWLCPQAPILSRRVGRSTGPTWTATSTTWPGRGRSSSCLVCTVPPTGVPLPMSRTRPGTTTLTMGIPSSRAGRAGLRSGCSSRPSTVTP